MQFIRHEPRLSHLEASLRDLNEEQLCLGQKVDSLAEGMAKGFEEIKSLLSTHCTEFENLDREMRSTRHSYNNNFTIAREILWKLQ